MRNIFVLCCLVAGLLNPVFAATRASAPTRVVLSVENMTCGACPITVRKALERVPGVVSAKVDYATKSAIVLFDPHKTSTSALTKATADVGYPSTVRQ